MAFDRSAFDQIDANLRSLEIDEIKKRLEPLMIGMRFSRQSSTPARRVAVEPVLVRISAWRHRLPCVPLP
jgi:hypothetical protein